MVPVNKAYFLLLEKMKELTEKYKNTKYKKYNSDPLPRSFLFSSASLFFSLAKDAYFRLLTINEIRGKVVNIKPISFQGVKQ